MPTEETSVPGAAGPLSDRAASALTGVDVADSSDVSPVLGRAAAEVAALKLRLAAVTRRADAAQALADAIAPEGVTLEEEVAALDLRLEQEHVDHRRRLDAELEQARADASEMIDRARAAAVEVVRLASTELEVAVAGGGGSPTSHPAEAPSEIPARALFLSPADGPDPFDFTDPPEDAEPFDFVEPAEDAEPFDFAVPDEVSGPLDFGEPVDVPAPATGELVAFDHLEERDATLVQRVLHLGAVRLVAIAIVVILLLLWVL